MLVLAVIVVLCVYALLSFSFFFFFNDTAPTEIYTLSLHDALPISRGVGGPAICVRLSFAVHWWLESSPVHRGSLRDRKSTRLNSSHPSISYAVFCLKKKKKQKQNYQKETPVPTTTPQNSYSFQPH